MASETSELTFVRCQTCRSLVPATASRCRICNATLEAASKSGDVETPAAKGRVRQKTVSASADEVASLVAQQSSPPPASAPASGAAHGIVPAKDDDEFDPLGAYLQDLDSPPQPSSQPSAQVSGAGEGRMDEMEDDLYDGESFEDEFLMDPPATTGPKVEAPIQREEEVKKVETGPVEAKPVVPPQAPPSARPIEAPKPTRQETHPKQMDQAPQRDRVQPPKNNQAAMRPKMGGAPQQQQHVRQEKPPQSQGVPNRGPQNDRNSGGNRQFSGPRGDASAATKPQAQQQKPVPRDSGRDVAERQETQRPAPQNAPRPAKIQPGRLVGWLVSYEHPDGRAIELRSGKFFITGSTIRNSDLILEDLSISTPHALVSISEKGFMLQDLMSERGTFVRSAHDTQYRREDGIIEVQHGDWIRFGDVEFLVTLVPIGNVR